MGRSKFPGKPPKTVTRKRIKVLGRPEASQNEPVTVAAAAENIYYGLSLFNETFGNNEKEHPPFHGFSTKEAKLSVCYIKTQQCDAETRPKKLPEQAKKIPSKCNVKSDTRNVDDVSLSTEKSCRRVRSRTNVLRNNRPRINPNRRDQTSESVHLHKTPVLKAVNNILERHQRTRQLRNSTAKRLLQRAKSSVAASTRNSIMPTNEKCGTVRKFVLPVRSAHSSRVIKPNKRFIEELEETSMPENGETQGERQKRVKTDPDSKCESTAKATMVDKELNKKSKKSLQNGSCDDTKNLNQFGTSSEKTATGTLTTEMTNVAAIEIKKSPVSPAKYKHFGKKCQAKTNSVSPTRSGQKLPNSTNAGHNSSQQKSTLATSKQLVLPDSKYTYVESSRVQTRSGSVNSNYLANITIEKVESIDPVVFKHEELVSTEISTDINVNDSENIALPLHLKEEKASSEGDLSTNSDNLDTESTLSETGSEHRDDSEDEMSEWTGRKLNGGKVILRKARLKLENKNFRGTDGPFSISNAQGNTSSSSNPGLTGTVKCGVCGAVRFYRFVKQARKFGIHSCESCRKFISKMIKRQACAKSTNNVLPVLQCHKGDGLCLVPPVVRSQQWNLMRCVYKARCPACWLKMCLKCYNIPATLRSGLNALLPTIMRDPLTKSATLASASSTCPEEHEGQLQRLTGCKLSWSSEDCSERNLFKSATSWNRLDMLGQKAIQQNATAGILGKKLEKFDYPMSISPSKKRKKENRIKVRKKVKNPLVGPLPMEPGTQAPPRQRMELKGPRVKHVCRSASVALGQPLATFPIGEDGKEEAAESGKNVLRVTKDTEKVAKKVESSSVKEAEKANEDEIVVTTANNSNNNNIIQQQVQKRGKVPMQQSLSTLNYSVVRSLSKNVANTSHTISIDFWEQYDPAEVGAKGFALIGSESFHIPAICYLCGSAGKDPLIHCQCCCEPYHAFCLEPSEWNACAQPNWCCPRCTVCQTCRLRSGPKLSCIRCRQSFHHSCLSKSGVSSRLYSPDRPYVCQSCIKCKSCGSEGVSVHVGNLPLCSMCFKLRQRGNYCPLCQRCYDENDFDTKMMECNECSCWVHARCEGLSDERYEILSYLPDSIEFTCRQCAPDPNSIWRSAIETELKAGFNAVIKSLSKNRKACAALKWSPRKECQCKPSSSARKLDFSDEKLELCEGRDFGRYDEYDDSNGERWTDADSNPRSDNSGKSDPEIDEQPSDGPRRGLRRLRQKFQSKECGVKVKNCVPKEWQLSEHESGKIPNGVGLQCAVENKECLCLEQHIIARPSPTLLSVKRKVNGNEYGSLLQFHCDMEHVINRASNEDLEEAYRRTLLEVFPWFDPRHSKITSTVGGLSTPTKEPLFKNAECCPTKLDDSILETWKEEVLRAPKVIAAKSGNLYDNVDVSEDRRSCSLCKGFADGETTREGRLLYCGQNEWVHANCALWSNEVFEEIDGSLQNVHSAISRGRLIRCTKCGKKGASVGCCSKNCSSTYHYPCARDIELAFNDDKTVYCTIHLTNCTNKTPQREDEFDLKRPVYVELDRKKKKYTEPSMVKVMIGSLTVDYLGTIVPEYSDTVDKIVPSDYKCSRLYWSTINPLKIVRYHVRTFVQVYVPEAATDVENNVTTDHSAEQEDEREKLNQARFEQLAVKHTLDSLVDAVCNKEADENLAEQNNTDLLPPELKEAIFEDLPHDLLDGISMQDIFPKMTYEDFIAMDLKNDGIFGTDLLKDEILPTDVDEMMKPSETTKGGRVDPSMPELGTQNDSWLHLETKSSVQDIVDDLFNSKNQKLGGRELKRSKSEVMGNNPLVVGSCGIAGTVHGGPRHHQRSCSLTWSCKLDGTYGPTTKRRKLPRNSNVARPVDTLTIFDSQAERSSMLHELRIPESIMVTVGRSTSPSLISDSVRELKYCLEDSSGGNRRGSSRDDTKDHKRLLWHARQQPRILQVDGTVDPSSSSECGSPEYNTEERIPPLHARELATIPQVDGANDDSSCDANDEYGNAKSNLQRYASRFSKLNRISQQIDKCTLHPESEGNSTLTKKDEVVPKAFKIPQLDGADDVSSDEECLSPRCADGTDETVTCARCRCTYRTQDSYDRHLSTCDIMTTSDSDSETMDNKLASPDSRFSPQSMTSTSPQFITMSPSEGHTLCSEYPDVQATSPVEASIPSPHPGIQIEPITRAIITPQIHATHATVETLHQTVLTSNDMIVQTQYTRTMTTLPNPSVLPHQQESTVQITEITDSPRISRASSIIRDTISAPLSSPEEYHSSRDATTPQISPTFSSTGVQTTIDDTSQRHNIHLPKSSKPRSPRTPKPRAKGIKPNILRNYHPPHTGQVRLQTIQNAAPIIQLQQQAQRPPGAPTVILQQVPQPNLMSAYVETLQQQSNQNLQYVTTISGQQENGYKPQFISANSLIPGAYIQTSSDNLLTLQNGGISVLPSVQIAQPQPTVLGTIIQQQPGAIQCGVISSEQLVLSSTPALEMFTDSTGSMFVSSQPMYYGLETIVSNTVMSSSQFVAGTVPQVLASSYQTTTQVFQASKLVEPMVDVQSVSAVPGVQGVPGVPGVPGVQTVPGNYVVVNQQPIPPVTEPVPPQITIQPRQETQQNFSPANCTPVSPVTCLSRMDPVPQLGVPQMQRIIPDQVMTASDVLSDARPQLAPTIPRVAVRPSPVSHPSVQPHQESWREAEPIFGSVQQMNNSVRPYFDSKHVSENTSMITSSLSSKLTALNRCETQRNLVGTKFSHDVNDLHNNYPVVPSNNTVVNVTTTSGHNVNVSISTASKITMPINHVPTSRPMNRVLPMQAITPKPEPLKPVEKVDIVVEEPTKPTVEQNQPVVEASKRQPTEVTILEKTSDINPDVDNNAETTKVNTECDEKAKENFKLELDDEKVANKSLKIVFQKQLQDGSYKITQNIEPVSRTKKSPQITSVEILSPKQSPRIASLQLLPMKSISMRSNKVENRAKTNEPQPQQIIKPKVPPIAVKKPRVVARDIGKPKLPMKKSPPKRSGLMYEIKSQDGFTHTASSMLEVWEKVFEAVQTARRAHNLPPLPHNPLTENLGLENNATVYLVEQLPGVNRCTKYKPKLHDLTPPKPGELESDILAECESGTARAEAFRGRKVHDMFSWLASRHRQQPKMIAISETESRRAASTNLPMAMRFRILKETSKESVGVYHSHIHGRGLFCLRDIEAGEMVIEYAGEVIRASLTDKREKYYDSKNIGCYMFKIDDHLVVDATMKGNAARFINHSCEPNCYSRVVDILGKKHILIFALRRIIQGEELTYDYKFPFEDIKIPCTCGSRRCRKYLN